MVEVIQSGLIYRLGGEPSFRLEFTGRDPDTGELRKGVSNEEVLDALVHRLKHQNEKLPCRENAIAIQHVETAKLWLEDRARRRDAAGVTGTEEKH